MSDVASVGFQIGIGGTRRGPIAADDQAPVAIIGRVSLEQFSDEELVVQYRSAADTVTETSTSMSCSEGTTRRSDAGVCALRIIGRQPLIWHRKSSPRFFRIWIPSRDNRSSPLGFSRWREIIR